MIDQLALVLGDIEVEAPTDKDEDERFWGVTTILKQVGDSEGLINWAAEQTAKAACQQAKYLAERIDNEGLDSVIEELRNARFRRPKGERTATELGSEVHKACEHYALTGNRAEVDDEIAPYLDRFDEWCQEFQPTYQAAEMPVYNRTYGYAGTCDAIVTLEGTTYLLDYKTSKKSTDKKGRPTRPWPDVALQLAAYRHAEFAATWQARRFEKYSQRYYLLSPEEHALAAPMPDAAGGIALHITPHHCNAHPVKCDDKVFDYFTFAIEMAGWGYDESRRVVRDALVKAA